jgi:4-amino-4-deoxy-L-arabinose transferase-like glycosyltransferase
MRHGWVAAYFTLAVPSLAVLLMVLIVPKGKDVSLKAEADIIEYQCMAVNLSEHDRFPFTGFIGKIEDYNITTIEQLSLSASTFVDIVAEAGPIVHHSKPPLYPLILGVAYKLFGNRPNVAYGLNALLTAFICVSMTLVAYQSFGHLGAGLSISSVILYALTSAPMLTVVTPNFLYGAILISILVLTAHGQTGQTDHYKLAAIGLTCALLMLVRSNGIPVALLLICYLSGQLWKERDFFRIKTLAVSLIIPVVVWTIFINIIVSTTRDEREAWYKNIQEMIEANDVKKKDYSGFHSLNDQETLRATILHVYSKYAERGPVLLTKQVNWSSGEELLGAHNEITAEDGWFHPEWRNFPNLYHNRLHLDRHPLERVLRFYIDNPTLICRTVMSKLRAANGLTSHASSLTLLLLALTSVTALWSRLRPLIPVGLSAVALLTGLMLTGQVDLSYTDLACVGICHVGLCTSAFNYRTGLIFIVVLCDFYILLLFFWVQRFAILSDPVTFLAPVLLMLKLLHDWYHRAARVTQ